ncbi:MAG: YkgJ family cysteine cluster protein [Deltaproteobacteria bacterium CG_4_8_14_3_um_filter_51_11]|nr:YkgJ family cysteine cluster protein [bacterium]OIP38298.1 MAG: hypothetical protein AUK25_12995 [Desulfobacteraceae bacterium CG2_30_51_40]PIP47217.1 MAG: hypothetical protein COX16_05470 [Deltaproteobacteria bacterium CG23_combo_of_CG06-09_8_20_14_all_51_20]PIX20533.1 MAG: YkgJ family cysteine cluster protein [Deltaproteobacteria bacterium CG_4_8_14_3_um_filter_51_11]PIY26573.1 MAG: YkgJ family cysteine cluster protein [Deltaproteobacteria bacterium CG_4_10_14_3_um_filter_51_14]PJB38735.1
MIFDCKLCGQCCKGEGGIFLVQGEGERISSFLGIPKDEFILQCCELRNGRTYIKTSPDGACLFYDPEKSCTIHPVKPVRCELWPFFPANLKDPDTFEAAKEACPGIRPDCSHDEFLREWERICLKK